MAAKVYIVVRGAIVECAAGTTPTKLDKDRKKPKIEEKSVQSINDKTLKPNTFGPCMLQPLPSGGFKPCSPSIVTPWVAPASGGKHLIGKIPAMASTSFSFCAIGGVITITDAGQKTEVTDAKLTLNCIIDLWEMVKKNKKKNKNDDLMEDLLKAAMREGINLEPGNIDDLSKKDQKKYKDLINQLTNDYKTIQNAKTKEERKVAEAEFRNRFEDAAREAGGLPPSDSQTLHDYSLDVESMYFHYDYSRSPFISLRKNYSDNVRSVWSKSVKRDVTLGFVGNGRVNNFRVNANFNYADNNGNNVPVKCVVVRDAVNSNRKITSYEVRASRKNMSSNLTNTYEFSFDNFDIKGFSREYISFQWMYQKSDGTWIDIDRIHVLVYFIPSKPNAPWLPTKANNSQNPWTDALDMLFNWGVAGKSDSIDIASQITSHVFGSGKFKYDVIILDKNGNHIDGGGRTLLGTNTVFRCTDFLKNEKGGRLITVNCSDCAMLVRTFSNLLGANLKKIRFGNGFSCNKVKTIGFGNVWQYPFPYDKDYKNLSVNETSRAVGGGFSYHEIASDGNGTYTDKIYDACLMVNKNVFIGSFSELLPANVQFGMKSNFSTALKSTDKLEYREMLVLNEVNDLNGSRITGFVERSLE